MRWIVFVAICLADKRPKTTDDPGVSERLLNAAYLYAMDAKDSKGLVDRVFTKSPEEIDMMIEARTFKNKDEFWRFVDDITLAKVDDFMLMADDVENAGLFNKNPDYIRGLKTKLDDSSAEEEGLKTEVDDLLKVGEILNEAWRYIYVKQRKFPGRDYHSTMIQVANPFVIPGERFKECYYWDSYWVIEGLLSAGMYKTAVGMVENFIELIGDYGFIPNGLRTYYRNRTQPPYFSMMLFSLYRSIPWELAEDVVTRGLRAAKEEHDFFMKYRKIVVRVGDESHTLNLYRVKTRIARPEAYAEDGRLVEGLDQDVKEEVWSNLKSAAESGWDFSARWMKDKLKLSSTRTLKIIPVDLNAIMYANELIISTLSGIVKESDPEDVKRFKDMSDARLKAINAVLWNHEEKVWNDYDYEEKRHSSAGFYVSNLIPMCYGISPPAKDVTIYHILKKYEQDIFGWKGGMPASGEREKSGSGEDDGQQWEYPNVWPPLVHIVTFFLERIGEEKMALHMARSFVRNISTSSFNKKEEKWEIFEKYDCRKIGQRGLKGEYEVQRGFGWTNGVAIHFLAHFSHKLATKGSHGESYRQIQDMLDRRINEETRSHHTPERCLLLNAGSPPNGPQYKMLFPGVREIPADS